MLFGDNVCIMGIIRAKDNAIYAFRIIRVYLYGYFEFIGIFRVVYHRIEITVSHVTHLIFRFRVHAHTRMSGKLRCTNIN